MSRPSNAELAAKNASKENKLDNIDSESCSSPTREETGKKPTISGMLDLGDIIKDARANFIGKEKGLGLQITSGSEISRPNKDSDFVCYPNSHWQGLTGIRGIPFGKIVQIAGKPDSGKSSHAMAFMKHAQDAGYYAVLWDSENKFSAGRFDKFFGGNSNNILVVQSKMIAEGGDQVRALVNAIMDRHPTAKILLVWDSVGGTLPSSEDEDNKSFRDSKQLAVAAKEVGEVLRGIVKLIEKYKNKETGEENIAVLLINQVYAMINSKGQKEAAGQKCEFFSSLILQLSRKADLNKIKNKIKYKIGIITRAKVRKNHLADEKDQIAELDLVVKADGIKLLSDSNIKINNDDAEDMEDLDESEE